MFFKIASSRNILIVFSALILIGVFGLLTEQIKLLIEATKPNFILDEVELEGKISILLASFGAFLEYRRWILEQVFPDGLPKAESDLADKTQYLGVFLILFAIFIECFDLAFMALDSWNIKHQLFEYAEVILLLICNLASVFILIKLLMSVFNQKRV